MSNDHDEPLCPAEALGQAITRAECAEAELRERTIELENAHGTINRMNIMIGEQREELLRLSALFARRQGGAA